MSFPYNKWYNSYQYTSFLIFLKVGGKGIKVGIKGWGKERKCEDNSYYIIYMVIFICSISSAYIYFLKRERALPLVISIIYYYISYLGAGCTAVMINSSYIYYLLPFILIPYPSLHVRY